MKKPSVSKKYWQFVGVVIITLVFILPVLSYVETYLHERAHQKAMTEQGINTHINIRLWDQVIFSHGFRNPEFAGRTAFDTPEDKERFLALTSQERYPIAIAGMLADLRLASGIIILLMIYNVLPWILSGQKPFLKWYDKHGPTFLLWTNVILCTWLLSIMYSTVGNMTANGADMIVALLLQ